MFCRFCGTKLEENNNKCNSCGNINDYSPHNLKQTKIAIISSIIVLIITAIVMMILLQINYEKHKNEKITDTGGVATSEITTSNKYDLEINEDATIIKDFDSIEVKNEDNTKRSQNIEVLEKAYYTNNGSHYNEAILVMRNNNEDMVDVTVYLNFYQGDKRVSSELNTASFVKPGSKFVIDISQRYHSEYDKVDITFKTVKTKSIYTDIPVNESEINSREVKDAYGNKIYVEYPFEVDDHHTSYAYIIFRKDGKMVYAHSMIRDNVIPEVSYYPSTYNVEYDSFEVGVSANVIKSDDY